MRIGVFLRENDASLSQAGNQGSTQRASGGSLHNRTSRYGARVQYVLAPRSALAGCASDAHAERTTRKRRPFGRRFLVLHFWNMEAGETVFTRPISLCDSASECHATRSMSNHTPTDAFAIPEGRNAHAFRFEMMDVLVSRNVFDAFVIVALAV